MFPDFIDAVSSVFGIDPAPHRAGEATVSEFKEAMRLAVSAVTNQPQRMTLHRGAWTITVQREAEYWLASFVHKGPLLGWVQAKIESHARALGYDLVSNSPEDDESPWWVYALEKPTTIAEVTA